MWQGTGDSCPGRSWRLPEPPACPLLQVTLPGQAGRAGRSPEVPCNPTESAEALRRWPRQPGRGRQRARRPRKRRGQRAEAAPGCTELGRAVPSRAGLYRGGPDTPEPCGHGRAHRAAAGGSHPGARAAGAGRAFHAQRDPVSGAAARAGG